MKYTGKKHRETEENGETKKHAPNERMGEIFRKKMKGGKQLVRYRVQNNGYKDAQET